MAWTDEQDDTLREMAEQGASVRTIAAAIGKGKSTTARRLTWLGVELDRSQVNAAAEAAREHNKARRALLSARLLDEAEHALDRIHEPYVFVTPSGAQVTMVQPDAGAHRNFMTVAGIAADKHVALEKVDTDGGKDQAVSVLEQLVSMAGIPRTAADAPDADELGTGVDPDDEAEA